MTRTTEKIQEIVQGFGYRLLDEYMNKNYRMVVIQDSEGYKYNVSLNNLMIGKNPYFVAKGNSFTLLNISLWLKKENKPFVLCENNIYTGSHEKLYFQCLRENCQEIFDMSWSYVYSMSCECPFCRGYRVGKRNNISYIKPELAAEWDYEKNKKNPEDYTCGSNEKVYWICSECGYHWDAEINSRSQGRGCPRCNQLKGEKKINNWLERNWEKLMKIGFINNPVSQKKFPDCKYKGLLRFDFGLEKSNGIWILIEYHGQQHYFSVKFFGGENGFNDRRKRDKIKEKYCKKNAIPLLVIPYWDYNNIENILEEFFY